jgi:hypothetical protein
MRWLANEKQTLKKETIMLEWCFSQERFGETSCTGSALPSEDLQDKPTMRQIPSFANVKEFMFGFQSFCNSDKVWAALPNAWMAMSLSFRAWVWWPFVKDL